LGGFGGVILWDAEFFAESAADNGGKAAILYLRPNGNGLL